MASPESKVIAHRIKRPVTMQAVPGIRKAQPLLCSCKVLPKKNMQPTKKANPRIQIRTCPAVPRFWLTARTVIIGMTLRHIMLFAELLSLSSILGLPTYTRGSRRNNPYLLLSMWLTTQGQTGHVGSPEPTSHHTALWSIPMSQKHEDGPRGSSRGHQFGRRAAANAGVPWNWVNNQESPEALERRTHNELLEAELNTLLVRQPELRKYCLDEYGRLSPARTVLPWIESKSARDRMDTMMDERSRLAREEDRKMEALRRARAK